MRANWINCLLYILKVLLDLHSFPLLNINCTEPYPCLLYGSYIIVHPWKSSPHWSNMEKVFKGFTPVKMCGVSPAASFYFVFVSSELPALCGTKVVQYNNVLHKFLSLPRQKIQIPHSLETLTCQIPHSHGTNLWSNAYVCRGNLKFLIDLCMNEFH